MLLAASVGPLAATFGIGLEDGLYEVGVDESSPYHEVAAEDDTFRVVEGATGAALEDGSVDLLVEGTTIAHRDNRKGNAALEAFRSSVESFNEQQYRLEPNQTAAFPVDISLTFEQQAGITDLLGVDAGDDGDDSGGTDDGNGSGGTDDGSGSGGTDGGDDSGGTDGGDDDGSGGNGGSDGPLSDPFEEEENPGGPLGDFAAPLSGGSVTGSPSEISPPFPFQSLVLAFLFVIPLNFLIQTYGSSILKERINRRGELMLVSPVSRLDIIAGKTLPYLLGAVLLEGVLAVGFIYLIQGELGGLISVVALTPLVLLFLGATFLGAMFARSFKELTFLTVSITVGLTSYAFVPAIFTDVNEIALISPLTIVVRELQSESVALPELVFSVTPALLVATVCFALGSGLYREEDMFDQRSIPGRVLDALAGPISKRRHVAVMTAVLIPFVFVAQLFAIALLFPLEAVGGVAIVVILVVVAITEELVKSLHVYASYEHGRFDRGLRTALVLGAASGIGFFVGEKIALLAQLVGLPELAVAEAGLLGGVVVGPLVLLFLLAPLVLHVVTAAISAVGASRGRRAYAVAVVGAMVIHFTYNMTVVVVLV